MKDTRLAGSLLIGAVLTAGAWSAAAGPIGTYYLTDLFSGTLVAIQGDAIQVNPSVAPRQEGPIAIDGVFVRTNGFSAGDPGGEYASAPDLVVAATGTLYANSFGADVYYDSTSDGSHHYLVGFNAGTVYRTDTDWSNPEIVFETGLDSFAGITYDRANGSLWLADLFRGSLVEMAMDGTPLNSYFVPAGLAVLAMDLDGTLWLSGYDGSGTIYHYDTAGTALGSQTYTGLLLPVGGEIVSAPASATLALLVGGALGLHIGRRRDRMA